MYPSTCDCAGITQSRSRTTNPCISTNAAACSYMYADITKSFVSVNDPEIWKGCSPTTLGALMGAVVGVAAEGMVGCRDWQAKLARIRTATKAIIWGDFFIVVSL